MTKANQVPGLLIKPQSVRQLLEPSGWRFLFHYFRSHRVRIALFCLVSVLNSALALPILYFIKYGFDHAIPDRNVAVLIATGGAILLCRALNSAIIVGLRRNIVDLIKSILRDMRIDLIAKLYVLPRDLQGEQDIARYHNRIVQDSERVDTLCNVIFSSVLPALSTAAALAGCLFYLQWKLVLIVFLIAPLIWLANKWTTQAVQRDVKQFQSAFERFGKGVLFVLRNRELTQQKAFDRQELARQRTHIDDLSSTGIRMARSFAFHGQVQRNLTGIAAVLLLVVGGISVIHGTLTLGDFMAFFAAAAMLNAAVDTVLDGVPGLISGNESLRLLQEIIGAGEAAAYSGTQSIPFAGGITLDGVSFSYGERPVLEDVSLRLPAHSITAIVGPNGAGKSTIVHLIMGILRPAAGALRADSISYEALDIRNLRRQIGIVPQHPIFFNGTLRENICYGHPGISEVALTRALTLAQATAFVAELPQGLESPMGEDGIMLSGGQKQRLALARALVAEPRFLILDEPANHLDVVGIRALMAALTALPERPTILMISHNADVTSIADHVLRLDAGRLSEGHAGTDIRAPGSNPLADKLSAPDAQMHIADTPRRSEAEQHAFFDQVHALARQAIAIAGSRQHDLRVAGITMRMIFAGTALEDILLPALRHLIVAPVEKPDITLNIWDSESTGVPMAPSPFSPDSFTDRGDIWGFQSKRFRSAFHWIEFSLNLMDVDSGTGIYWVRSARALPFWTKSSPFRSLIHWSLEKHGGQLIHAAAVGYKDGAVLITGRGGVGKSTTSLACVSAGLFYVADDYLAVTLDPEPMAHSLYCTAKVNRDQMARFPEFAPLLVCEPQEEGEKAVMLLYPGRAEQVLPSLPLRAIVTPSFGKGGETSFRAVLPATLQGAASFTTLSQLPHAGQRTVDFIQELVRRLPGLEMVLGHDVPRVPDAIRNLLDMSAADRQALAKTQTAGGAQSPLISVIIPVYNGARFLAQAVETVLTQNYPAIEIIVIDDGSSDEIEAAVQGLPTDVRFFRQDNGGAASARNRGVRDASGEYLAFLDVDDLWPQDKIAIMVEALLTNPALDVVQGYAQVMTHNPQSGLYEYSGNPEESYPFYIGAALYRRRAFETIGLFDPTLRFSEDSDWFARAREAGLMIKRLEQVTLLVRRHGDNMTSGKSMVELNALQVLKKALDRKRSQTCP